MQKFRSKTIPEARVSTGLLSSRTLTELLLLHKAKEFNKFVQLAPLYHKYEMQERRVADLQLLITNLCCFVSVSKLCLASSTADFSTSKAPSRSLTLNCKK